MSRGVRVCDGFDARLVGHLHPGFCLLTPRYYFEVSTRTRICFILYTTIKNPERVFYTSGLRLESARAIVKKKNPRAVGFDIHQRTRVLVYELDGGPPSLTCTITTIVHAICTPDTSTRHLLHPGQN